MASTQRTLTRLDLALRMAAFTAVAGLLTSLAVMPVVGTAGLITRNSLRDFQNLPADLTQVPLPQQNVVTDVRGVTLAVLYAQNRITVPLETISPVMQQAMIAIEDVRFFQHSGIDVRGTLRALLSTSTGSQVQGGSTITQQYVKQILLAAAKTPEEQAAATAKSLTRKVREARYAIGLENKLTKKQILEGYMNSAYFGAGSYGVEVAARRYFSTTASELTLTQAATLAGLVQSPSRYDPTRFPEAAAARRNEVLNAMSRAGYITDQQATEAKQVDLKVDLKPAELPNGCTTSEAPFFCDYVLTVLRDDPVFGKTAEERARLLNLGGLTIRTTLDLKAQRAAQNAANFQIPPRDKSGKAVGITMVQPGTGHIVAMAQNRAWGRGGIGKTAVNYNAPLSHNGTVGFQAGSTFKAFTIAAALKQGFDPYKMLPAPQKKTFTKFTECEGGGPVAPYTVKNSTGSGAFNMLSGTALSVNTYFVGLEEKIGLCGPPAIAKAAGAKQGNGEDFKPFACFTLGCFDTTTLDMATAMATFAAHGYRCDAIAIQSITDRYGKDVPVPSANCAQTIDATVADSTTAILAGVIKGPIGGATGRKMYFGRDAAGKTGTTDSSAAVWFVGYTPDLAAAVWVGDPRGGQRYPMKNIKIKGKFYSQIFGSLMPGPVWRMAMAGALKGTPKTKWQLNTLFGLNAGGFGNDVSISKAKCDQLEGSARDKCLRLERQATESPSASPSASPTESATP